jgi:hypothetical protein
MYDNQNGDDNTSIGSTALFNNTSGSGNTSIGSGTGIVNITGSNNTYIGYKANGASSNYTNTTAIGAYAYAQDPNVLILGSVSGVNGATTTVNVGIGTTSPERRLHVANTGTSGGSYVNNTIAFFESNSSAYIQLSTPNGNDAGIYSGNVSTAARSVIQFGSDSSIYFKTGGSLNRSMTISNQGYIGIATSFPDAHLDVQDDFKLGANGTVLNEIIKGVEVYDIPSLATGAVDLQTFTIIHAAVGSVVSVSPLNALPDGITISYARVSTPGVVEVKFVNAGNATQNPASNAFYFVVIR